MTEELKIEMLFPEFERWVKEIDLLTKAQQSGGFLLTQLYRILGQGTTRAGELSVPPTRIERMMELSKLKLPDTIDIPENVKAEIKTAREHVIVETKKMLSVEEQKNFARIVIKKIYDRGEKAGYQDGLSFAGRFVLSCDKSGLNWSWSVTQYYPIIDKMPLDVTLIVTAWEKANELYKKYLVTPEEFSNQLELAYLLASHFSKSDKILVSDIARFYRIASQKQSFWSSMKKKEFEEISEASFILNLINWHKSSNTSLRFNFSTATINQTMTPKSKTFYLPKNDEGTQVRPIQYLEVK